MPRKNPKLTDEENRAKYREYQARYRAKKAEQQRQAGNDTTKSKPAAKALETLKTEKLTDAEVAALINSFHGFTEIIAEHKRNSRIVIAERMLSKNESDEPGFAPFRVKTVEYHYFKSRLDALTWMKSNGCSRGLREFTK